MQASKPKPPPRQPGGLMIHGPRGNHSRSCQIAEHACQPHASAFGQYGIVGREANLLYVRLAEMSGYSFHHEQQHHRASPL